MKYTHIDIAPFLAGVEKPARYIGHERNSIGVRPTSEKINFCLAFPDVYEVGISHLGLKILYSLINRIDQATADRVYAPWPDMGEALRSTRTPLFAIESRIPVRQFDVAGFTLQSEMTWTNILYMLDLSGIPLLANERGTDDPIVLGGGPAAVNPEPVAPFFDAILIGEAEDMLEELVQTLLKTRSLTRKERLSALSGIQGMVVPSMHKPGMKVRIRKFAGFDTSAAGHSPQLIPWVQPTHNRYTAEIMRGCTRGCRFCQAGFFYRPVRERPAGTIAREVIEEVRSNGWEEAGLCSLSSTDYTGVKSLISMISEGLSGTGTRLSLPSLRVDSLDPAIIALMNENGQKGLTIAPEAGSQRLRNIINKNITEEEILRTIQTALDNGWQMIKLYFMVGLPHETDEDVDAIVQLLYKIGSLSRRRLKVNVTLSPFVPKPFTPFQWCGMNHITELQRKIHYIRNATRKLRFVKIKYHRIQASVLEGVLSRGDRSISGLILEAYRQGAVFDEWDEGFDFEKWTRAAEAVGIDLEKHLAPLSLDTQLPWDFIDTGISRDFLLSEYHKAINGETTQDCRETGCEGCGLCGGDIATKILPECVEPDFTPPKPVSRGEQTFYRAVFHKTWDVVWVSHLDILRMFHRVLRASGLPLSYTQGFHPHPRINLSPPLPLGVEGEREFIDFALDASPAVDELRAILEKRFPPGLTLVDLHHSPSKKDRDMESIRCESLRIHPDAKLAERAESCLLQYGQQPSVPFTRIRKGKERTVELKEVIHEMTLRDDQLILIKELRGASVFDILETVFGMPREECGSLRIVRTGLYSVPPA